MTDNVAVTAGTGTSIATDEVAGAHYQRVKVTWGADGVAGDVVAANALPVQLRAPNGTDLSAGLPVTGAFWQATQPVSAAALPLPTGAATEATLASGATQTTLAAVLAKIIAAPSTEAKQDTIIASLVTLAGLVDGLEALLAAATPAGSAIIGKVGIDQTTPGTTNGTVPGAAAVAGGISSTARLASAAASTNATNVKTSAGRIYSAQGYNAAAYPVYLVLYDSAASPPVPGATTIRKKIPIPAGAAFALDWPVGLSVASGIGYAFTKLAADADTTALVAADVLQFNLDYV